MSNGTLVILVGENPSIAGAWAFREPTTEELINELSVRGLLTDLAEIPDPHNQPDGVLILFEGEALVYRTPSTR